MRTKRETFRVNADGWWKLADILCATPEDFNPDSASLRGRSADSEYPHTGRLSGPTEDMFRDHRAKDVIAYVIYSYSTPIAWCDYAGKWTMPADRYSVTTSKHQGKVRTALSQISGGID